MVASKTEIYSVAQRLTHEEACRLADLCRQSRAQTVILDMTHCMDASTAAFARLVLLRGDLLKRGRDFRLAGLQARAARLFEVHRLDGALPRISALPVSQIPPAIPSRRRVSNDCLIERAIRRPCAMAS